MNRSRFIQGAAAASGLYLVRGTRAFAGAPPGEPPQAR